MKIPRAVYGTHSETKKWCMQHVKLIVKGARFEELESVRGRTDHQMGGRTRRSKADEQLFHWAGSGAAWRVRRGNSGRLGPAESSPADGVHPRWIVRRGSHENASPMAWAC